MADGLRVTVRGAREVSRALDKLPAQARGEFRRGMGALAGRLTQVIRAAGRADSKQSARAAETVTSQVRDLNVVVSAGPHPLLYGSEFGALRRFGWYSNRRYAWSPERQFRTHRGSASYWFFKTYREQKPAIDRAERAVADRVIAAWSA